MKKILIGLWLSLIALSASAQDKCSVSPESCMTAPIAQACPSGKKWSTTGSGVAHCVAVDPVCASSDKVAYDNMGNPSCVARCSAGTYWDGSSCQACTTTSTASGSCQSGYNGTAFRSVTTNTCAGTTNYGPWDYSGCTLACTTSTSSESASCPAGYNGTMTRTNTTNSCSGTTYGNWDQSGCTVACTTSTSTQAGACQANYTGTAYRTVSTNSCTGAQTYGGWNYSGCTACTTTTSTESGACQANYVGTAYRTVSTNTCTGAQTYGTWNYSGCSFNIICPNGQTWNGSSCAYPAGWCPYMAATMSGYGSCPAGGWGSQGPAFGGHGEIQAGPPGTVRQVMMSSETSFAGCQAGEGQVTCTNGKWVGGFFQ